MRILLIGAGDIGCRIANGVGAFPGVDEVVLAGLSQGTGPSLAGNIALNTGTPVRFVPLDGTDQAAIEKLLREVRPGLIAQCGTLLPPGLVRARADDLGRALAAAGPAALLTCQIPLLLTLMRAVRAVGYEGPVTNLTLPDSTHAPLAKLGLAPTVGLGNVTMAWLRVRAEVRRLALASGREAETTIRLLAHQHHLRAVGDARKPEREEDTCQVYLGEQGQRADDLAYTGIAVGRGANELSAAASVRLLQAFLPEAPETRISASGPLGLTGGYPIRIHDGHLDLDLPPGLSQDEAAAFNRRGSERQGIANIENDGTIVFGEKVVRALAGIAPRFAEPLRLDDALSRCNELKAMLMA